MDACPTPLLQHVSKGLPVVYGGPGVSHHHYGGKAPGGRRCRPGHYVLLLGEAGIAEMDMDIHQARSRQQPLRVDYLAALLRLLQPRPDPQDSVPRREDVQLSFPAGFGVYHISVLYEQHVIPPVAFWPASVRFLSSSVT